ncbi:MAG: hypothetical protein SFV54_26345 [Bryobacteraceae bacterium]|nr:hypothetical protein [Bryobacteraceae bacterium]
MAAITLMPACCQPLELFGGYTARNVKLGGSLNQSNVSGWHTAFAGYFTERLGIAVDLAGFDAAAYPAVVAADGSTLSPALLFRNYSLLAGPQVRLFRRGRFETSLRALFGVARARVPSELLTAAPVDLTSPASLLGLNFDVNVSRRVAVRFLPGLYTTHYDGSYQTTYRFSVGPVFRFGGPKDTR